MSDPAEDKKEIDKKSVSLTERGTKRKIAEKEPEQSAVEKPVIGTRARNSQFTKKPTTSTAAKEKAPASTSRKKKVAESSSSESEESSDVSESDSEESSSEEEKAPKAKKAKTTSGGSSSSKPRATKATASKKSAASVSGAFSSLADRGPYFAMKIMSAGTEPVHPTRVRILKEGEISTEETKGKGSVIYWMSRDQRVADNWALLYAQSVAQKHGIGFAVVFNAIVPTFLGAPIRHYGFMMKGLQQVASDLKSKNIPFFMLFGDPSETLPIFLDKNECKLFVCDFTPTRIITQWKESVMSKIKVPFHEVDAHNVVPVWIASDKQETAARTIRTKINGKLGTYLTDFPALPTHPIEWTGEQPKEIDWTQIYDILKVSKDVPEVDWAVPGERGGIEALNRFLDPKKISKYSEERNLPNKDSVSNLSPWLHFGVLSAQRAAFEAQKLKNKSSGSIREGCEGFLEELVVRRELAENFCFYNKNYDSFEGFPAWAQKTLKDHSTDKREKVYTLEQFERGKTHEDIWNAAQLEMVHHGKMHGFMRMYWAKKILEWSASPEEALKTAIYLNDKYSLDGRDPNGWVGCAWAIGGVHDQGWAERPVFGKIRYMNYAGCKRKFDISAYVAKINDIVRRVAKK